MTTKPTPELKPTSVYVRENGGPWRVEYIRLWKVMAPPKRDVHVINVGLRE